MNGTEKAYGDTTPTNATPANVLQISQSNRQILTIDLSQTRNEKSRSRAKKHNKD